MPMTAVQTLQSIQLPQEKMVNVHLLQNQNIVRKLAPAPDRASVLVAPQDQLRCKKKINFNHLPYAGPGPQPASVARRNARERNRVKQVNNGFATLRQHIPSSIAATAAGAGRGASKKLSKVDTLRLAVEYIRSLQDLLDDHDAEAMSTVQDVDRSYCIGSPDPTQQSERAILSNHTPPSSEASVSPTPSFASETAAYVQKCTYPAETYENYEPMSPEDEELLDVIYWWQQQ